MFIAEEKQLLPYRYTALIIIISLSQTTTVHLVQQYTQCTRTPCKRHCHPLCAHNLLLRTNFVFSFLSFSRSVQYVRDECIPTQCYFVPASKIYIRSFSLQYILQRHAVFVLIKYKNIIIYIVHAGFFFLPSTLQSTSVTSRITFVHIIILYTQAKSCYLRLRVFRSSRCASISDYSHKARSP